jgi:flagellar biosynthesis protein FlhG
MRCTKICVSSMKGGVGKTEVALNLAVAIRKKTGRKVLIVDFDIPYGGIAPAMGIEKNVSLTDWLKTNRSVSERNMESLIIKHKTGIDVIPAIASSSDLRYLNSVATGRILDQLSRYYDYIVIDSGVDLGDLTKMALIKSDSIIIVTSPTTVSIHNNYQYKEDLARLGIEHEKMMLFINQANKKSHIDLDKIIKAYQQSGNPVNTVSVAYYDDQISRIRNQQKIMYTTKRLSNFSKAIDDVLLKLGIGFDITKNTQSNGGLMTSFLRMVGIK